MLQIPEQCYQNQLPVNDLVYISREELLVMKDELKRYWKENEYWDSKYSIERRSDIINTIEIYLSWYYDEEVKEYTSDLLNRSLFNIIGYCHNYCERLPITHKILKMIQTIENKKRKYSINIPKNSTTKNWRLIYEYLQNYIISEKTVIRTDEWYHTIFFNIEECDKIIHKLSEILNRDYLVPSYIYVLRKNVYKIKERLIKDKQKRGE